MNDFTTTGVWPAQGGLANTPVGGNATLVVFRMSDRVLQVMLRHGDNEVAYRHLINGSWMPWFSF